MHDEHKPTTRAKALLVSAVGLLALLVAACSPQARFARALTQADAYYKAGDYDRAEIAYKNALQRVPDNPQAMARLGAIYQEQGRDLRALAYLLRAVELQPAAVDSRFRLGLAYLAGGRPKEARDEAIAVLDQHPAHPEAALLLADATTADQSELADTHRRLSALPGASERAPVLVALGLTELRRGRTAEAEAIFKKALAADPRAPEPQSALGKLYWARNDLAAADAALRQAAELSPARSASGLSYARFKLQTGEAATARKMLESMVKNTPDFVTPFVWLAELAVREKKYDEAENLLVRVIARDNQQVDALLSLARVRLTKGDTARGVADLESLAGMFPKSAPIAYELAMAYVANGDTGKALGRLSQLAAGESNMPQAALALADVQLRRREYGAAITTLEKLLNERPNLPNAKALLADAHRGQGNLDEAGAIYASIESQFPRDARAPFWRGVILLQQDKRTEARAALERALALAPGQLAPLELLVEADLRDKWFPVARQRVEAAIAKGSPSGELHLLLAKVLRMAGDSKGAERALSKAAELQPNTATAYFNLAQLYVENGQPEKAVETLKLAEARDNKQAGIPLLMGLLYESSKNEAAACAAYERCLALDPKNRLALNNLAYLYSNREDQLGRAEELAQTARDLLPGAPEAADTLGWILYRRGQYGRAMPYLEQAAAQLTTNAEVQFHLGMAHYMMGHEEPARRSLAQALKLNESFNAAAEARECLALLEAEGAKSHQSAAELEGILSRRKNDPLVMARLAVAYEREGQMQSALALHEKIVKANPDNIAAALNVVRLYHGKDTKKALELAKAARKQAPSDPRVGHVLGRLAYESGEHAWAVSLLEEASRQQTNDPELQYDLAEALYGVGRIGPAEEAMRRAIQIDGSFTRFAQAKRFLEMSALAMDPPSAAAASVKIAKTLTEDPTDVATLLASGTADEYRGNTAAAKEKYAAILQRYPDFAPAQRRLAILYAAAEDSISNQRAYDLASKARKTYSNDAEVAKVLGVCLARQGSHARAVTFLQESMRQRPDDAELLFYLGRAQLELKRPDDAKMSLQRALGAGLNSELADSAREMLGKLD